ncbi:MAG: hypothetical protein MJE77_16170 [Proteobacteria bacterium]|nr:hypothetical protein [Pseudomonadota bacterium]
MGNSARHTTDLYIIVLVSLAIASCGDPGEPSGTPSAEVAFDDPGLQGCYENLLRGPDGKPYAEEITILTCFNAGIRNLDGIEVLSGLEQLLLSGNELQNIAPVLHLPELNWLDLGACGLQKDSVQTLSRLETQVRLDVSLNNLEDVSPFGKATSLTGFIAANTGIKSGVAQLATLVNARILSLDGNSESPCSDLETLRAALPDARITPSESDVRPGIDCSP